MMSNASTGPRLLAGGNPQIPKGYGPEPVAAWIAAAPGWKGEVSARLDAIICAQVPGVEKAVKWNSPLYGLARDQWFLGFHCITAYIKVAFMQGALLDPPPPVASKQAETRYYHVTEDGPDEAQFADWVRQAAKLPGVRM